MRDSVYFYAARWNKHGACWHALNFRSSVVQQQWERLKMPVFEDEELFQNWWRSFKYHAAYFSIEQIAFEAWKASGNHEFAKPDESGKDETR